MADLFKPIIPVCVAISVFPCLSKVPGISQGIQQLKNLSKAVEKIEKERMKIKNSGKKLFQNGLTKLLKHPTKKVSSVGLSPSKKQVSEQEEVSEEEEVCQE